MWRRHRGASSMVCRDSARSRMESIGSYLPARVVTNEELLAGMTQPPHLDMKAVTGIERRRVYDRDAQPPEDSLSMALDAARTALNRSSYDAADLDVVINCSITRFRDGDTLCFEPSFALTIKNELGAERAIHFDISNACAGMLTGVLVLDSMIRSGAARRGMVVSGERITPIAETAVIEIADRYDPQFASLTVGDAAAAVILDDGGTEGDRLEYIELMTCSKYSELCIGQASEKGPRVALYTDNRAMHNADRYRLWTMRQRDFLAERGTTFADEEFDFVVHHQFSKPAADVINVLAAEEFDAVIPPGLNVLEDYGNTASTSHFVVLDHFLQRGAIPPGSKLLLVPAASGVVAGYLALTLGKV